MQVITCRWKYRLLSVSQSEVCLHLAQARLTWLEAQCISLGVRSGLYFKVKAVIGISESPAGSSQPPHWQNVVICDTGCVWDPWKWCLTRCTCLHNIQPAVSKNSCSHSCVLPAWWGGERKNPILTHLPSFKAYGVDHGISRQCWGAAAAWEWIWCSLEEGTDVTWIFQGWEVDQEASLNEAQPPHASVTHKDLDAWCNMHYQLY